MRSFALPSVSLLALTLFLGGCSQNPHLEVQDPPKAQSAAAVQTSPAKNLKADPDRDHDGVLDKDDICPDVPGPVENRGCPFGPAVDDDHDGVPNDIDECPLVPGAVQNNGCPFIKQEDSDEDGVPDTDDRCPQVKGPAENQGCPFELENDADHDGVTDDEDKCPTVPGPLFNDGCPIVDSDGDGVIDQHDECPLVKGPAANNGCPLDRDTDGDWLADDEDKCPTEPGPIFNDGCPLASAEDADHDGIPDSRDQCKYLPGPAANYGCPYPKDEERSVLLEVKESLKFDFDRATIKASSFPALERLVAFMKKYPGSHLKMVGHTDDVGSNSYNQALSEDRVASVSAFLSNRGIHDGRIQTAARGESEPLVNTHGKEGAALETARAVNRRVDMSVSYVEVR